jgi:hypothetical protein
MGSDRSRTRAAATCVLLLCALGPGPDAAVAEPALRVDLESFWWEDAPPPAREGVPRVLDGASERVLAAVAELLRRFPEDFPQPPPLDVVVRAQPRIDYEGVVGIVADTTSYGGAKLEGATVYVDVHRSVFMGWDALNDAELRSFLGHELIHAYQFGDGPDGGNGPELWRRELAAYAWEVLHMDAAARPWYRNDAASTLRMYADLVRGP